MELVEKRLENLQFLFLDGQIDVSEYQKLKSKLVAEATNLKQISVPKDVIKKELKEKLKSSVNMLGNLSNAMMSMGIEEKHQVLSSIFPEKIQYDGKNCRTLKMNQVLLLLLSIDKGSRGPKNGTNSKKMGLSQGVEPAGVEPASKQVIYVLSTRLLLYRLSGKNWNRTNLPFP